MATISYLLWNSAENIFAGALWQLVRNHKAEWKATFMGQVVQRLHKFLAGFSDGMNPI